MEGLDQPPTIDKVNKATSAMNSNRVLGKDSIPAEIFCKAYGAKRTCLRCSHHCSLQEQGEQVRLWKLYFVFIDLTKALDTVNREVLWTVLERYGCPICSGDQSAAFITNRVKQGCILAPVLFNLVFTCMLAHAVQLRHGGGCLHQILPGRLPL